MRDIKPSNVYFHYKDEKIEIMGESKIKPILARYVSKIY